VVDITPVVLTYNEAPNIGRTLSHLEWASRVVVIDSRSSDETREIAKGFANVTFLEREFDTHARQWNFGLEQVTTDWVLSLDADYIVTEAFRRELERRLDNPDADGYFTPLAYCIFGKPLRASLLPPRCTVFTRAAGRYVDDGHTQRLELTGRAGHFEQAIQHDDRKPLDRWLRNQVAYARLEAEKLTTRDRSTLRLTDKIRSYVLVAPALVVPVCLIQKGCLFDGWRGIYYTLQRLLAEVVLSLLLIEKKWISKV
jgi:glycosyltransferase involved in cell wall biosynthesis